MIVMRPNSSPANKPTHQKAQWLAVLETELRRRMGWVDEAITPFGRTRQRRKVRPNIRNAA